MFYNEQKKHVRTKKDILDDNGNIRKGCKVIKKGEVYERTLFTAKNKLFKDCAKWDKAYGEKDTPKAETMHEKIQRYKEKADRQNASQPYRSRDKGAR